MLTEKQHDFFTLAIPAAKASQAATGVPASITIAQAILESGWGISGLAESYNNFFGIKANREQCADDDYCELTTREDIHGTLEAQRAKFAQYADPAECFTAHAHLLTSLPRYRPAMAVRHDADKFAWALGPKTPQHPEGCGYSTLPAYHDRLMQLIREYGLQRYDAPAANEVPAGVARVSRPAGPAGSPQEPPADADVGPTPKGRTA
jgi:flagellum-specific peptidoglycan hydrolase FlgJ